MENSKGRIYTYRVTKICLSCDSKFVAKSGLAKYCSTVCREKSRYLRDREKRMSQVRAYRLKNRNAIGERRRKQYRQNKDKYRQQGKTSYQKNRLARIENALRYQKQNPHVPAATRLNRAAAKRHLVTSKDLRGVVARQRNECFYCKSKMTRPGRDLPTSLQWDHVIPKSRGGTHSIGNIVASCRRCNSDKAAMLVTEWKRFKLYCTKNLPNTTASGILR